MHYFNNLSGITFGWHLQKLFAVVAFVGLILFVIWAVKNLKPKKLLNLTIWLLVVGILGMLLTNLFIYNVKSNYKFEKDGKFYNIKGQEMMDLK